MKFRLEFSINNIIYTFNNDLTYIIKHSKKKIIFNYNKKKKIPLSKIDSYTRTALNYISQILRKNMPSESIVDYFNIIIINDNTKIIMSDNKIEINENNCSKTSNIYSYVYYDSCLDNIIKNIGDLLYAVSLHNDIKFF